MGRAGEANHARCGPNLHEHGDGRVSHRRGKMFPVLTVTWALALGALVLIEPRAVAAQALNENSSGKHTTSERLDASIQFSFDIRDLVTNQQFEGQRNSFSVTYEYAASLRGGPFDPNGHPVSTDSFPYFQTVQDDIVSYVRQYPDRSDFYEVFASNIARHVMGRYRQFRWMELKVRVPAFAGVTTDRTVVVRMIRDVQPQL